MGRKVHILSELDYRMLHPKSKVSMYISSVISILIYTAIAAAIIHFVKEGPIVTYTVGAVWGLLTIYEIISPIIYYNHYRYCITDDRIDIRKGVLILRHIVVPIERLHQVEVKRGPINNMLGLANVSITTAGSSVTIDYLENRVAEEIISELNDIINSILRSRNVVA